MKCQFEYDFFLDIFSTFWNIFSIKSVKTNGKQSITGPAITLMARWNFEKRPGWPIQKNALEKVCQDHVNRI